MKFDTNQKCKPWQLELFRTLAENEPVDPSKVSKTFCVLATPRCGSTLFCDVLNNTGLVGWTEEWFNAEYFYSWQQVTGLDFTLSNYVNWIIEHSTRNGIWGVKWHVAQVHWMQSEFQFGMGNIKFNHRILLRRRDKISQAVSMAKALKSDQFRSYETCRNPELPAFHEIAKALHTITDHEDCYNLRYKLPTDIVYWYEDYQNMNEEFFDSVLEGLGVEPPLKYHATVKKQRNETTEELADQFKAYLRGEL